ncbi:DMT family transporter [Telmatospirillum sp. J64-1]|uniref:DMT family transporter n=1 Tax=Telmatospirillum sp. J64-1 TaxID=2502183 RepID=UPI00115D1AA8|nr:EamA family transporter [Telmatospirillum sp. J64-1]
MSPLDLGAACITVLIWGLNFVAVKVGVEEIPPLLLVGVRFALVAAVTVPFLRPRRSQLPAILLLSFTLGVLHFGVLFIGMKGVDAATAAIAIQLQLPFSSLMAWLFFRDKLGWRRMLGMSMAFIGVAFLAGEPQQPALLPLMLIIGAGMAWALSNVVIKRVGEINPLTLNGWMALFAAPQVLLLSVLVEGDPVTPLLNAGWAGWGAILYTVVGASLISYTLWYYLLAKYTVNQVVPFTLLAPVIGIISGVLLLGEPFTWHKAVGGGLTILGVTIIQLREIQRAQKRMGQPT